MPSFRSPGIRILLILLVLSVGAALVGGVAIYFTLLRDLPEMDSVAEYRPLVTSRVLDRKGRLIGEFYEERRMVVPFEDIPRHTVLAFVAGEDSAFFRHEGLDYLGILRAAWVNLAAGGEVKQGGSTITQQTVKGLLLTPERKIQRKIKEMILARRLERKLSKDEILWLYLNQIYFGQGAWGIGEAARSYFGKEVSALTVSESALLAGLPQRPSEYSPTTNPEAAENRRRYVLQRMRVEEFIDEDAFREALTHPPELREPKDRLDARVAAYFVEDVRRLLYDELGSELVLRGGLTIQTTLDLDLQRAAQEAVSRGLEDLDRRQGWRGAEKVVSPDGLRAAIQEVAQANGFAQAAEAPKAAEGSEAAEGDEAEAEPAVARRPSGPRPVPTDEPLAGVVVAVDPEQDTARVAFAPEIAATVRLSDVRWASRPDPSRLPRTVRNIESIFHVGQVANFWVLPDEADRGDVAQPGRALFATLHQLPEVEGALLSFDLDTGAVRALVGGYDYERSEFDRATQARRQAGSAFKPVIYAAALDKDYTPASILVDRPVVYEDPESGFVWRPQNYSRKFLGRLPVREALARSVNNATIHLFRDLKVDYVVGFARRLGIESPLARDLSLALGSSSVTLLEMARAYAVFPAGGKQVLPLFVTAVLDREGELILGPQLLGTVPDVTEWHPPDETPVDAELARVVEKLESEGGQEPLARRKQVISPQLAYLATDLLRAAVFDDEATGRGARELGRTVAGKTGTTNFGGDAWFIGFSPDVATGVWIGYDEKRVLGKGETGGRTALPVWRDYMKRALAGRPNRDFPVPDGIVFARVDRETGMLASAGSADAYLQAFNEGTAPTQTAKQASRDAERGRLLRLDQF